MTTCTFPSCRCDEPCDELLAETPAQLLARVNRPIDERNQP